MAGPDDYYADGENDGPDWEQCTGCDTYVNVEESFDGLCDECREARIED